MVLRKRRTFKKYTTDDRIVTSSGVAKGRGVFWVLILPRLYLYQKYNVYNIRIQSFGRGKMYTVMVMPYHTLARFKILNSSLGVVLIH